MSGHDHHGSHRDHHHGHGGAADRHAYDASHPDAGREVIVVELEASEIAWSVAPGSTLKLLGFNGRLPEPTARRMYHGHIPDHHEAGMMAHSDVMR